MYIHDNHILNGGREAEKCSTYLTCSLSVQRPVLMEINSVENSTRIAMTIFRSLSEDNCFQD
jgi:hypothetical protein